MSNPYTEDPKTKQNGRSIRLQRQVYGRYVMPLGTHKGKALAELDVDYLEKWAAALPDNARRETRNAVARVNRYLEWLKIEDCQEMLDRPLPRNQELERELIGALFVALPKYLPYLDYAYKELSHQDFYDPVWQFFFNEFQSAWRQELRIQDEGVMMAWLRERGAISTVGEKLQLNKPEILGLLAEAANSATTGHSIPYCCKTLRSLRKRRALILVGFQMLSDSVEEINGVNEVAEVFRRMTQRIIAIPDLKQAEWPQPEKADQ